LGDFFIDENTQAQQTEDFKIKKAAAAQYFRRQDQALMQRIIESFAPGLVFLYLLITSFM